MMWAELDEFPGLFGDEEAYRPSIRQSDEDDISASSGEKKLKVEKKASQGLSGEKESDRQKLFGFAIARMKEITPFLLNGMINGWTFDYTPLDRARHVEEFYEFGEVRPFDGGLNPIEYKNPEVINGRLVAWAYCDRTENQQIEYSSWESINHPKVRGRGKASLSLGFEGIKEACAQAAKNAVREYWRGLLKNKPKELSGELLLIKEPRIFIKDGNYVVDLDFFIETAKIKEYSVY